MTGCQRCPAGRRHPLQQAPLLLPAAAGQAAARSPAMRLPRPLLGCRAALAAAAPLAAAAAPAALRHLQHAHYGASTPPSAGRPQRRRRRWAARRGRLAAAQPLAEGGVPAIWTAAAACGRAAALPRRPCWLLLEPLLPPAVGQRRHQGGPSALAICIWRRQEHGQYGQGGESAS